MILSKVTLSTIELSKIVLGKVILGEESDELRIETLTYWDGTPVTFWDGTEIDIS